jgi:hypothetical protein
VRPGCFFAGVRIAKNGGARARIFAFGLNLAEILHIFFKKAEKAPFLRRRCDYPGIILVIKVQK